MCRCDVVSSDGCDSAEHPCKTRLSEREREREGRMEGESERERERERDVKKEGDKRNMRVVSANIQSRRK